MKKSIFNVVLGRGALGAAIAMAVLASAPLHAQTLWGAPPAAQAASEPSKTDGKKPEAAQGFMAADLPNEGFLRALSHAPMAAEGPADCILITRTGEIPVKGSEPGDYLRAWSDFMDQQGVVPMGGMELGIKAGALSSSRVASNDNGVGADKGALRAFVLTQSATAAFDEHFEPQLTQQPGEKPRFGKGGLSAQVLFGPNGQRIAVRREAGSGGAAGVSHYSVRQGEGLILAIPGDGVIRWIALAAFPLPPGALSQGK